MWILNFKSSVEKDTKKINKDEWDRINKDIQNLKINSLPPGVKKIKRGKKSHYRIRNGNFRIGYQLDSSKKLITIIYIKRRSEDTYK
ncbi:MAG TPA: type II toxin-antitoxin system RelE/ParE family toxin [Candidatus Ratteibacteria bacterium]|nr:type II toxin-antitoxin system RelE/ParE family toxin [Candidatus Ratteibacteria bacterium]